MTQRSTISIEAVPGPIVAAVVAALYFALAQYVIWLNDPVNAGSGYWPAAGVTLAALLLLPVRRWAWVLGAVVVAETVGGLVHDYPLAVSPWWAAGNAIEPLVSATLLRRLGRGAGRLSPLSDLLLLLAAGVVVGPLVGALIGGTGSSIVLDKAWTDTVAAWWVGDGLGVLVVVPLLLCLREPQVPHRKRLEGYALAACLVVVPLGAYKRWDAEWDLVLPYLLFPIILWAAIRFGIRGAAVAGFTLAAVTNLATALEFGPFHEPGKAGLSLTVLQLFLGLPLTVGLVVANVVTDVLNRTRAFEQQRSVADALQLAVLPEGMPVVPGFQLAARYAPAIDDATIHVGGDWYDAFELPSGAMALAVGDVGGHDLPAAVVMAQLRNGLRSLFMDNEDPASALASLDRQLAVTFDGLFATAISARLSGGEVTWSNAGHPPLLLAPADGSVRYLAGDPDPMLGIGEATYSVQTTHLEVGDVLIGFTDGLIEHRSWSLDDALDHLAELVKGAPTRDPETLCDLLLEGGLGGRPREDDVCVLVLRRTA
ncbi:MAG: Serine phosphatase RsbU, regulator of sigma subunit [uncultured Acidimicrobiales bacterium]|uniref:Serine phosphatase RsbU, regulator of sigma subunit n=1 Tax=uncultured Acidimicrobiales bacterium TaxID=310071 RepID=A0A6J4H9A8_9ACTN|nr:MAG: Serine phosphatase RsbU, regulator of sigma subunit [uncultured Acidimicrobiales bacterium]